MTEVLAPAGGKEHFLTAIRHGADAVYFGMKRFSARASAENFDCETLEYCLNFAHAFGAKAYAAVNTAVKDDELYDYFNGIAELYRMGVDGFIMQDIFLGARLKDAVPDIRLHLSTQGGAANAVGARVAKSYGFSRVVAARETSIEDIKEMSGVTEVETFVQGALCTAFSGQCLMSAMAGGNSANRGRCKQPCRKKYSLNGGEMCYAVSMKDLNMDPESLSTLVGAGVSALKIEGRMRRSEYVAAAVDYVKNALGGFDRAECLSALKRTYNRGDYTRGLAYTGDVLFSKHPGHIGERVGKVTAVKGNKIIVSGDLKPQKGDGFKIMRRGEETGAAFCTGASGSSGKTELNFSGDAAPGDEVRITTDTALNARLKKKERLIPVKVKVTALRGKTLSAEAAASVTVAARSCRAEAAKSAPLDLSEVRRCFSKTDIYPFAPEVTLETDGVFVPKSELNELRREVYEKLFSAFTVKRALPDDIPEKLAVPAPRRAAPPKRAAIASRKINGADIAIYFPEDYFDRKGYEDFLSGDAPEKYLYLPAFLKGKEIEKISEFVGGFDGVYGMNLSAIGIAESPGVKLFMGTGFNIFNSVSAGEAAKKCSYYAYSSELTAREAAAIGGGFYPGEGEVKVMDFIHCPYGGHCAGCSAPDIGKLTDEEGREFPIRRYKAGRCAFALYNSRNISAKSTGSVLCDYTLMREKEIYLDSARRASENEPHTAGRSVKGVI